MTTDRLKGRPASLERWPGERMDRHRALLLWAMQHPARGRSGRAVSRAMGCSDGSVRNWRRDGAWDARAEGPDTDEKALELYRRDYLVDHGVLDLPYVAGRMVQPLAGATMGDPAVKAAHEAARAAHKAAPEAIRVAEQAAAQAVATRRHDARKDAEKHLTLVDASLGVIAQKLKANEVRVGVRDIPVLLECRERLVQVANGETTAGPMSVVESARVQHAKATGGDVVDALWGDIEDQRVILQALRTRRDVDVVALAEGHAHAESERERTA